MEGEELTEWLKESGRRRQPSALPPVRVAGDPPSRPGSRTKEILWIAALSTAFLQYYFLDVMLTIQSLPTFVLLALPATG